MNDEIVVVIAQSVTLYGRGGSERVTGYNNSGSSTRDCCSTTSEKHKGAVDKGSDAPTIRVTKNALS